MGLLFPQQFRMRPTLHLEHPIPWPTTKSSLPGHFSCDEAGIRGVAMGVALQKALAIVDGWKPFIYYLPLQFIKQRVFVTPEIGRIV